MKLLTLLLVFVLSGCGESVSERNQRIEQDQRIRDIERQLDRRDMEKK